MRAFAMLKRSFLVVFAAVLASTPVAADVTVLHDGRGGEPGTILIHSKIKKGDWENFAQFVEQITKTTNWTANGVPLVLVDLDTPGGDVVEALRIGKLIRERFMTTRVLPGRECLSACVFVLLAGSSRAATLSSRIGLHRPRFDSSYFANMSAQDARTKYNAMLQHVRSYFIEMGGVPEAFEIMLSTSSDQMRYLTEAEKDKFGFRGADASWEEFSEARMIKQYGLQRWRFTKACAAKSGNFNGCLQQAYELYPAD